MPARERRTFNGPARVQRTRRVLTPGTAHILHNGLPSPQVTYSASYTLDGSKD
jgi:hypothetical protein